MKIIGAGLVTADIVQPCDSGFRPLAVRPIYTAGGTVCNVFSYLATFGFDCKLVGGVGADALGPVIREDLEETGIDTGALLVKDGKLSRRIAELIVTEGEKRGVHEFRTQCYSCGREFPNFVPPDFQEIKSLIASDLGPQTVLLVDRANQLTVAMAEAVTAAGGYVVFEPGYVSRDRQAVENLLLLVDILKFSEELRWQGKPFAQSMPTNHPRLKITIETRSAKGVIAHFRNRELKLTTTPLLDVVDSAGAGDAFMAGFLSGILRHGLSEFDKLTDNAVEEALQRGQALGGLSCLFLSSKGLLFANKNASIIEDAIRNVNLTHRPPPGFGSQQMPAGIAVSKIHGSAGGECPICFIS